MQLEVSMAENELQKIDALYLKLQLPQGSAARPWAEAAVGSAGSNAGAWLWALCSSFTPNALGMPCKAKALSYSS